MKKRDAMPSPAQDAEFGEVEPERAILDDHLSFADLRNVRLVITGDLGECTMMVRDVLDLKRGSIIALDRLAGELIDIYLNGVPFAKGEVVVIADTLHVRVAEVIGGSLKEEETDV